MKKLSIWKKIACGSTLALLALPYSTFASNYQLFQTNASNAGDGGAGGAAIANNATTAYNNPAGLTRLNKQELIFSAVGIDTYAKFNGTNTWSSPGFPTYTAAGSAHAGTFNILPSLYYSLPLVRNMWFGFSSSSTYGLATNYNSNSVVRYSAVKGILEVANLSPSLAFKLTDQVSLAGGIDLTRILFYFDTMTGAPGLAPATPRAFDTIGKANAYGWGIGGHIGALFQLTPDTRVGVAYHSRISSTLVGGSTLQGPLVTIPSKIVSQRNFSFAQVLPATTALSAYHDFNSRWSMDGTINYTQWSQVPGMATFVNVAGKTPTTPVTFSVPQHYRDTFFFGLGANYKAGDRWILRGGVNYDETPVKSRERNVILPDGDRVGLAIGAHYQASKKIGIDAGWTHIFVQDVNINYPTTIGAQTSTTVGTYKASHADIFGAQLVWDI